MAEQIVYVDENGKPTGKTANKLKAHYAKTKLHLAFSCYIFNKQGELLVTQRAKTKKVWPGVWTNSVCGHPAPKEELVQAIKRRAEYELGINDLREFQVILPKYRYKTPPFNGIIENEFCPVYFARTTQQPKLNKDEVEDFTWMTVKDFTAKAQNDTNNQWSYWCKDQVRELAKVAALNKLTV